MHRKAETALGALLSSISQGSVVDRSTTTTEEFLRDWLASQQHRLRATTLYSYEKAIERVTRRLGKVPVQALPPLQIEKFYAGLLRDGARRGKPLSAKTVRNSHVVLRKALADAERLGLVFRNAAASARPPTAVRKEFATWSSDDLREFFAGIGSERVFPALVVFATTGMRRGEVLGLRWSDVDLDAGQLAIVQTLTTINGKPTFGATKSSRSRRVVYIDPQTVSILREHRKRQREERLIAGPAWTATPDLVFRDEAGVRLQPDLFTRTFSKLVAASGLTPIRLHDLRHTYATLALKAGVHPKIVSERLGHATVGITLDLYSHVTPAIAREAAGVVADRIFE
ncbi:MAG: tyrosine-type recombinase/integrase [Ilumatobacteraceae bacterium]